MPYDNDIVIVVVVVAVVIIVVVVEVVAAPRLKQSLTHIVCLGSGRPIHELHSSIDSYITDRKRGYCVRTDTHETKDFCGQPLHHRSAA